MPPALLNILRYPLGQMKRKKYCYPLDIQTMIVWQHMILLLKMMTRGSSITLCSVRALVRLLPYLQLLCSIFIQAGTLFCSRTFMHSGRGRDPPFLSQSHHLTHIRSLFINGSRRSSLTSGTLRILLRTPKRATLIHRLKPTQDKSLSLVEYVFLTEITFMFTHSLKLSMFILFHCIIRVSLFLLSLSSCVFAKP